MGDKDNFERDATLLEFILHQIQQMKHDNKEPSKSFLDECDDPGSGSSTVSIRVCNLQESFD